MFLPIMELDPAFADFNFCDVRDPTLRFGAGPTRRDLIEMVYNARHGDRGDAFEFCRAMYWTLREQAFSCFEKVHGPRAMLYRDWFYCKLVYFLNILVYERLSVDGIGPDGRVRAPQTDRPWEEGLCVIGTAGPVVQDEDVMASFVPEDNEPGCWGEIVDEVCAASGSRLAVLEKIMALRRQERAATGKADTGAGALIGTVRRWEWHANRRRNRVIRNLQAQGKDGREICEALDELTIAVLPILRANNIHLWVEGWDDPRFRKNIRTLFSKSRHNEKSVKA